MTWAAVAAAGIITGGSLIGGALNGGPSAPNPTYGGAGGGQPYFYQPTWQGGADTQLQGYFQNYQNPYFTAGPAGVSPMQYSQGLLDQGLSNPYAAGMMGGAQDASNRYGNGAAYATQAGQGLYMNAGQGLATLSGLEGAAGGGNPYWAGMVSGAGTGGQALGQVGGQAIGNAAGLPGLASSYAQPLSSFATSGATNLGQLAQTTTSGLLPYGQNIASFMPTLAGQYTAPGNAAASQMLSTAFDPQGALYAQQFQQNQDQTRAALAARGLNTSGVGTGIELQSNRDFNTNWQNQQLGRQAQGLSAYDASAASNYGIQSGAYGQGLNSLLSASTGTFNPYATAYSAGVGGLSDAASTGFGIQSGAATTAEQLGAAGAGDIVNGAALPYNAQQKGITDQVSLLGNIGQAQGSYANLQGVGGGQLTLGAGNAYQAGAMPYNAYNTQQGNYWSGINNYLGAAGQGQGFNQNQMGDLMQYMGMGPSAAEGAFNSGMGAWGANNSNMNAIGQGFGSLASMYPGMNPYPGGPTGFGNMFNPAQAYGSMPNLFVPQYNPSAGYGSPTPLTQFNSFGFG